MNVFKTTTTTDVKTSSGQNIMTNSEDESKIRSIVKSAMTIAIALQTDPVLVPFKEHLLEDVMTIIKFFENKMNSIEIRKWRAQYLKRYP